MPEDELCSYCFGGRLRMMQSSPYSAYDEMYADMLEYVNEGKQSLVAQMTGGKEARS